MKKSLSLLLALAMVLGMFASVASADDSALTTEQKYQQLVDGKVLKGTTDGKSHLEDNLTRAEFATIAVAVAGLEEDTASASAFADVKAGQWWTGAITAANKAGLVNGVGNGLFSPKANVTVEQVIKVAALMAKLTPVADATVEGASAWAAPYIKAAQDAGLPVPTNYTAAATRGQTVDLAFAVFQAAAAPQVSDVKAVVNSDNTVTVTGKVTGTADSVKVTVGTNAAAAATLNADGTFTYTSAALAIGSYNVTVVGYNGTSASVAANTSVEVTTFGVTSATAINAKQIAVVFNKAVNSTSATTLTNYKLNGTDATTATVGSDGVTVTLTFASTEIANSVLVVSPIQLSADTNVVTKSYSQVFNYTDSVKPTITSVVSKTNTTEAGSVTITASEPISSTLVKVDGNYYPPTYSADRMTITVSGLTLSASASHTIDLINLTDYASTANVTVDAQQSFSVTVDKAAPTFSLSVESDKTIVVTFNKDMNGTTVLAAFNGGNAYLKDETLGNVTYAAATQSSATVFKIPVTQALYGSSTTRTLTLVFPNTITDSLGNAITATTASVTLTKDTVKPTATGYKFVKNGSGQVTDIIVSFSEGLAAQAANAAPGFTIVNMNGVDVSGSLLGGLTVNAVAAGDKQVTIHANVAGSPTGKYAITFPGSLVMDQAQNALGNDSFSQTWDFGTSASSFGLAGVSKPAANQIKVDFGRAVKGGAVANSATDVSNYTLAGKPLTNASIVLDSTQQFATITLGSNSVSTSDVAAVFTVNNVMSLNGEMVNSYVGTLAVTDNTAPILSTAVLNSDGSITVSFNETLTVAPVAADFVVTSNGSATANTAYTVTYLSSGADAGKYVVKLTTGSWSSSTSLSIATASSGITGADAAGNTLATSKSIAIK